MDKSKAMEVRQPTTPAPRVEGHTKWDVLITLPVEEQLKIVESALESRTELLQRFLSNTDETDWDDFHGKPRLNEKGALKGARMCFLDPQIGDPECVETERHPQTGELLYFRYQTKGRICLPWGQSITAVGSVDSDYSIHCERKDKKGKTVKLPASQVNRSKVCTHSHTQCLVRGVTAALGLKRLTWDDVSLVTSGKVTRARVQIAGKKGKSALEDPAEKSPAQHSDPAPKPEPTDEQRLWEGLKMKAKAVGLSSGSFWALIVKNIPRLDMPQTQEETTEAIQSLTKTELQVLWKAVDEIGEQREPGSDDDADTCDARR